MNEKVVKTIEEIVVNCLCTGCGTCVGICPKDAIMMEKSNSGVSIFRLKIVH